ncbi:MAG: dihydroorotase [Vulcanococcus sp.]
MTSNPEQPLLLHQVQLLEAEDAELRCCDVLLQGGQLSAIGAEAASEAQACGARVINAQGWLLAPPLVDPHSELEDPAAGSAETLASLERSALAAGYGTVALLPRALSWRDRPERLQGLTPMGRLQLLLWGSFRQGASGGDRAGPAEQLAVGAIGLAEGDQVPPMALLERGFTLAECGSAPLLLAPRDPSLSQGGFVREGVEALRAGWPTDPSISETLPLQNLVAMAKRHPQRRLQLMNLSTAEGVALLRDLPDGQRPEATVCWWHLVADSGSLDPIAEGWRVVPPLGTPADRQSLLQALSDGVITAVAVHHQALDAEEQLLPLDQRKPGVAGHRFVLPRLWQELVEKRGWSPAKLWQVLCFAPARLLGLEAPRLSLGSDQWVLFDPNRQWCPAEDPWGPQAANQPAATATLTGQVLAHGLIPELMRWPASPV